VAPGSVGSSLRTQRRRFARIVEVYSSRVFSGKSDLPVVPGCPGQAAVPHCREHAEQNHNKNRHDIGKGRPIQGFVAGMTSGAQLSLPSLYANRHQLG